MSLVGWLGLWLLQGVHCAGEMIMIGHFMMVDPNALELLGTDQKIWRKHLSSGRFLRYLFKLYSVSEAGMLLGPNALQWLTMERTIPTCVVDKLSSRSRWKAVVVPHGSLSSKAHYNPGDIHHTSLDLKVVLCKTEPLAYCFTCSILGVQRLIIGVFDCNIIRAHVLQLLINL